jgi:hypothetical protein
LLFPFPATMWLLVFVVYKILLRPCMFCFSTSHIHSASFWSNFNENTNFLVTSNYSTAEVTVLPRQMGPCCQFLAVLFLSYKINSQSMMVTWPLYKQQALYEDIQAALKSPYRCITPKLVASILGKNGRSEMWHLGVPTYPSVFPKVWCCRSGEGHRQQAGEQWRGECIFE